MLQPPPETVADLVEHRARLGVELTFDDDAADNLVRAGWAIDALAAMAAATGVLDEEPATALSDLLGNLRHLADALDFDFGALTDHGYFHYAAEVASLRHAPTHSLHPS